MNDATVKAAIGQLLKNVNFTAQRELEKVVRAAMTNGKLKAGEPLSVSVTLVAEKIDLNITIFSKLEVQ
ncbi:MAG TPA: DUF6494 family protein [Pseudolabrys sp.]|jgi:hypothetical protein